MGRKLSGRELVKEALEFDSPERVPRDLWWLPAVEMFQKDELDRLLRDFPMDIYSPDFRPGASKKQRSSSLRNYNVYGLETPTVGNYIDEWGSIWEVREDGVLGEVKSPVLENLEDLRALEPPWEFLETTDLSTVDEQCAKSEQFVLSGVTGRPFERMQFIRGTENLYKDLIKHRDEVKRLRDIVHRYQKAHIEKWLKTDVDAIWLMDDWGSQDNLLIPPGIWRDFYRPLYREYCDMIHRADKYVFFHSDGCIEKVLEDVADIGIDALNSQLFTMDWELVAKKLKGRVTLWGEIDRQYLLPFGSPDEIKRSIFELREILDDGKGGVIAQCEWGKENPDENVRAVYEAWAEPISRIK